jgi:hydroxymethylpyrimidine/phosphomethylpyrimidine kinase
MRTALTIAGSDSGGGAGIQADLKTFAAHGVYGVTALTAVTAQNTMTVSRVLALPPDMVRAQMAAVASDFQIDATKIGMLATAEIAMTVASAIAELRLAHVVLDPVMIAKGGSTLLDDAAVAVLRDHLMPLAEVVTPNMPEAEALTGWRISSADDLQQTAVRLVELGARAAIVKGGHLDGPAVDLLFDGGTVTRLQTDRLPGPHTHGTGCTFSSALAARLALGDTLIDAARRAKAYVTHAIARAPGLGHGAGPLGH